MKVMVRVIADDPAVKTCQALFWLVLGAVFSVVPSAAIPVFRKQLGEAWYSFTLQVMAAGQGDREAYRVAAGRHFDGLYEPLPHVTSGEKPVYRNGERYLYYTGKKWMVGPDHTK